MGSHDDEDRADGGKLREIFGSGSLTGGAGDLTAGTGGTGGLGTGAGDVSGGSYDADQGDVITGGREGVDTTGYGPAAGSTDDGTGTDGR